jgi:hypothetical protein
MDQRVETVLGKMRLFLSAFLAAAGILGLAYVIKLGVLPTKGPMGHTSEYEQGWTLFFMLLLGIPSLAAFIGGITPWILWVKRHHKGKRTHNA